MLLTNCTDQVLYLSFISHSEHVNDPRYLLWDRFLPVIYIVYNMYIKNLLIVLVLNLFLYYFFCAYGLDRTVAPNIFWIMCLFETLLIAVDNSPRPQKMYKCQILHIISGDLFLFLFLR